MENTIDLNITRIFDAPRAAVWKAWTDSEQLMKWWGPENFTCPVAKIDFKVGGKYHFCMRAPDGKNYWSTGVYDEIVPMEKIVFTDSFSNEKGEIVSASEYGMVGFPLEMVVIVTFEEIEGGKTKMNLLNVGHPAGEMADGAKDGWSTSFNKLAASLK